MENDKPSDKIRELFIDSFPDVYKDGVPQVLESMFGLTQYYI